MRSSSTSARSILGRYGLARPFDFSKALPFVIAMGLFLLVLAAATLLALLGKLTAGTDRWWFLLYVGIALLLAAGLSFAPRVAWCLLAVAVLEIGISVGTTALAQARIGRSLFPEDGTRTEQFVFHPLLQVVPKPNFEIARNGKTVRHNQFGLRGAPIVPDRDAGKVVIAVVGGSTTYSAALSEGSTWPDALQATLGDSYRVLNFGVPGYSSAEHVVQTAFYLNKTGLPPRCALYYIGWNDIRNAHIPDLDPGYADFHLLSQLGNLSARRDFPAVRASPLLTILFRQAQQYFDSSPLPPSYRGLSPSASDDKRLEDIYRRNIRSIAAINQANGVKSLFVGQLLNRAKLTADKAYGWLPLVKDKDVWPLQEHFNEVLRDESAKSKSPALILDVNDFDDADFVDNGHFSEQGSRKFAGRIAGRVAAECGR